MRYSYGVARSPRSNRSGNDASAVFCSRTGPFNGPHRLREENPNYFLPSTVQEHRHQYRLAPFALRDRAEFEILSIHPLFPRGLTAALQLHTRCMHASPCLPAWGCIGLDRRLNFAYENGERRLNYVQLHRADGAALKWNWPADPRVFSQIMHAD